MSDEQTRPEPWKQSRFSWFRCPHCGVATNRATSRTALSKQPPRVVVDYQCNSCRKVARLRRAGLTHVGLPVAIGLAMVYVAYTLPIDTGPWYSPASLAALAVLMIVELALTLIVARLTKRFDKCVD